MAELYDYEADDGTVYEGLSIVDALKLKQEDEERAKRQKELQEQQASDAKLGPQISAGIHAYEARKFQGQPQATMSSAGPAPAVSIQGMSDGGNIQPVSMGSQFEGTPAFDSVSSNPSSISGMSNNNKSWRPAPTAQEIQASEDYAALTKGIPPEALDELHARWRMGEFGKKPSQYYAEVLKVKKIFDDARKDREKEEFQSKLKKDEEKNKAFYQTEDKLLELDSQERRNRENIASAERMNREDNATLLETSKNKGNNPNDIFGREYKLRSQYNQLSKDYRTIRDAFEKIEVSSKLKNASGDMALVYGFMRLQDPTSTVREGEYATAENARGVPESVMNLYNKTLNGTKLSDRQREEFLSTAKSQYQIAEQNQIDLSNQFKEISLMYQLDPDRVMGGTVQPGQGTGGDGSAGTGTQINQPIKVGKYTIKKVQ